MGGYILIIDDQAELEALLRLALFDSKFKILAVADIALAKRKLVQAIPGLILVRNNLGETKNAGLQFCEELRNHASFSGIPVLLLFDGNETSEDFSRADNLSQAVIRKPVSEEGLRDAICKVAPSVLPKGSPQVAVQAPENVVENTADIGAPTKVANPAKQKTATSLQDSHFKLAQRILAQVLHNLKTSDLLGVATEEDVPRIVFEMARKVCGIKEEVRPVKASKVEEDFDEGVELDLDKVFGSRTK